MSLQTEFDTVVSHVRKQRVKSTTGGDCAYRGLNNTKCAIGCLIPDAAYDKGMEGKNVYTFRNEYPKVYKLILDNAELQDSETIARFYSLMQQAHDHASDASDVDDGSEFLRVFERRAQSLARDFGLKYTAANKELSK